MQIGPWIELCPICIAGGGEQERHHDSGDADDALRDARLGAEAVVQEPPGPPHALPGELGAELR